MGTFPRNGTTSAPWCFNPCCIGLGVGTSCEADPPAPQATCFNPCCIGLGVGTSGRGCQRGLMICFNPCCIGLGVGTGQQATDDFAITEFQSLLYWIGRGDCGNASPPRCQSSGFNPCCIGLGVGTAKAGPGSRARKRFQSLLYWIGRGDDQVMEAVDILNNVSILVVLDWAWGRVRGPVAGAGRQRVSILVVLDWAWGLCAARPAGDRA